MKKLKMLDRELQTYEAHKAELLAKGRGKWVLIKGARVAGVFDTEADAIRQGYERFGNVPFMVKEIVEIEVPVSIPWNLLGV